MNVLAYLKLDIVYGDSHRNRLLMFVKHISECCQEAQENCSKNGLSLKVQVQVMFKLAKELSFYMSQEDLMDEFKIIEALEPSMLCAVTSNRIKNKLKTLNQDIEHFHKYFGLATEDIVSIFKMPKHGRNSRRPLDLRDSVMVNRFCQHVENVLATLTDLDQRLQTLKALIQPPEDASMTREENLLDQLENIRVNGEIIKNLFKAEADTKRDIMEMRKLNMKVNTLLRDEDVELSEYDLQRLKMIKKHVSNGAGSCRIVSHSNLRLITFDALLLKFQRDSKCFRLKLQQKCLDFEKYFLAKTACSYGTNQDLLIVEKMASFFKEVLDKYKMFDSYQKVVVTKLDKIWIYYM